MYIKGAPLTVRIGVTDEEREQERQVFANITLPCDVTRAARDDSIDDTINYSSVYKAVRSVAQGREYKLIETLAERIAETLLEQFHVSPVVVEIRKPGVPKGSEYASITIERSSP